MTQVRLTNLAILSIKNEITNEINIDNIVQGFTAIKSRKLKF